VQAVSDGQHGAAGKLLPDGPLNQVFVIYKCVKFTSVSNLQVLAIYKC
jgi:hypothetical protein